MRKSHFCLIITLLCLGSLLTCVLWYNNNVEPYRLPPRKKNPPQPSKPWKGCAERNNKAVVLKPKDDSPTIREGNNKAVEQNPKKCKTLKKQEDSPPKIKEGNKTAAKPKPKDNSQKIREVIDKAVERHCQTWKKQEDNYQQLRSNLSSESLGLDEAIFTQSNKPVGSKIVYEAQNKTLEVTPELFSIFIKDHPLSNKTWDTCAVVGNGGILINSSCGETIDSAQFVIRCNLPPLSDGHQKHVGIKTDFVTANPSIFFDKYGALMRRRRPFVESLRSYGDSLMLLPAFSYSLTTAACRRAVYAIEDFESPIRPVFLNPDYLKSLLRFWRSRGLTVKRLSTGLIMASLALELCSNVHLYGFWPFSIHPHGLHPLTNHYYDDVKPNTIVHAMPAEFDLLLKLHSQGVLRLHLGDC